MTRTMVGLDIGGSGVRAAEFGVGRRSTLRRFASVPLPEGVVRAGLVVDGDALAEALKRLWAQGKFSTKDVVIAIANDGVLVRQMDLEWMPPADFRKALRYQVADALPVPVDEANLDYYMLEEITTGDDQDAQSKVARVMLVAAGREMVDGFVRSVQAAGLRPSRVDLLPFALVRAVTPGKGAEQPLEAIIDIGAHTVVVVVHQGGHPRFVRTLTGHGGQAITAALMQRYDWDWDDAERTKIALGLPGHQRLDGPTGQAPADQGGQPPTSHPAHEVIAEQVNALVAEVRATLDYYRTSAGDDQGRLVRLVLTGRAAGLGGLSAALEKDLELPVEHLSVLDRMRKPRRMRLLEEQERSLAVPAGLCLRPAS